MELAESHKKVPMTEILQVFEFHTKIVRTQIRNLRENSRKIAKTAEKRAGLNQNPTEIRIYSVFFREKYFENLLEQITCSEF